MISEFEIIIFNKEEQEEEGMATSKDFRIAGKEMVDYICDYLDTIEQRPPLAQVAPGYLQKLIPKEAPQKSESWEEVKKDIERVIMPGVSLSLCYFTPDIPITHYSLHVLVCILQNTVSFLPFPIWLLSC